MPALAWTLTNANTGNVLDSSLGPNPGVTVNPLTGLLSQNWLVTNNADGTVALSNQVTDLCLDSNSSGNVYTDPANGGPYQNWLADFVPTFIGPGSGENYTLNDAETGLFLDSTASGDIYTHSDDTAVWVVTSTSFGEGPDAVSETQFNQMFPQPPARNAIYSYGGLVAAMGTYPQFATTGDGTVQLQEAAAFLANVAHETGGLQYAAEQNPADPSSYCDPSQPYGCPAGQSAYYGRGSLQLTGNINYNAAGDALGAPLLDDPDLVSNYPDAATTALAWKTGLWYWTTQTGTATMTPHDAMVNGAGFGQTIQAINGPDECGPDPQEPGAAANRVALYEQFAQILGVDPGTNLTC